MMRSFGGRICQLCLVLVCGVLLLGCAMEISLQHGEELIAAGRWEEAVVFYLDAVRQDPRNIEARIYLARALNEASNSTFKQAQELEAAGRVEEATAAYQKALQYNGENRGAQEGLDRVGRLGEVKQRLARARDMMLKSDLQGAQNEVRAALALIPSNLEAKALQQEIESRLKAEQPPARPEKEQLAELFAMKPVTLRFRDTDIKEVLEVLARTAGVNIFTDETLPAKRVTIFLKDLPLREAFNMILVSNRLFAKQIADNTVIVVPDNPGKRQQYDELIVQTFYLSDADAKVTVNLLRTILNTRQIFVNEKLNALVVRETPEKIELAKKLLEANDRGGAEVEIDVEVLEVDRTALENLGIDIQPRTYSVSLVPPAALPFLGPQLFKQFAQQSAINTSGLTPALILNLVKNDSNTKILANPTVRILDRQKARLLIGQRRPFQISSLTSVPAVAGTSGSGSTPGTLPTGAVTTTQTNVEYRDIGLKLTLTPTIGLTGDVTIELSFEISAVGAAIVSASTGGELIPPVNTRNIDTFVKVRNGETRLLGGLLQQTTSDTNSKFPFLSDIPFLGRLFTNPTNSLDRVDVLISLTPRLVKTLERPAPDIERFSSGTAEAFGPAGGAISPPLFTPQPAPAAPAGAPAPAPSGGAPAAPPAAQPAGPRP